MVVEELGSAGELREENEDIAELYSGFSAATCSRSWRLSFFARRIKRCGDISKATGDEFLGYAIIKADDVPSLGKSFRVYESVIRASRHQHNCIHGAPACTCRIAGCEFEIEGYPYAQQNGITNSCAHVSLRTATARFNPLSFRRMNEIARVRGRERRLDSKQLEAIVEESGARWYTLDLVQKPPDELFHKYIYGSIESGYPAIVLISPARSGELHALPIFGHTFSEDTWVPRAESSYFRVGAQTSYISSEAWLSMYIGHDDNWGSNFCIPRGYLRARRQCQKLGGNPLCPLEEERFSNVMATFPVGTEMSSVRAEVIGADYLFTILPQMPQYAGRWGQRLQEYAGDNLLVLRPVLIGLRQYAAHLAKVRSWSWECVGERIVRDLEHAPDHKLWMVELSVPELFSANRRKVGEVLLWAEKPAGSKRDFRSFAFARLPGCLAFYDGGGANMPRYNFFPTGVVGHVELFGCEDP